MGWENGTKNVSDAFHGNEDNVSYYYDPEQSIDNADYDYDIGDAVE